MFYQSLLSNGFQYPITETETRFYNRTILDEGAILVICMGIDRWLSSEEILNPAGISSMLRLVTLPGRRFKCWIPLHLYGKRNSTPHQVTMQYRNKSIVLLVEGQSRLQGLLKFDAK